MENQTEPRNKTLTEPTQIKEDTQSSEAPENLDVVPTPKMGSTREDRLLVQKIVERLQKTTKNDVTYLMQDLIVINANGCLLDFKKLLESDDVEFVKELHALGSLLDRETGKLPENYKPKCFSPDKAPPPEQTIREIQIAEGEISLERIKKERDRLIKELKREQDWEEVTSHLLKNAQTHNKTLSSMSALEGTDRALNLIDQMGKVTKTLVNILSFVGAFLDDKSVVERAASTAKKIANIQPRLMDAAITSFEKHLEELKK